MSWDVSIIKFSKTYHSLEEIPENCEPLPLGRRAEVQGKISLVFPETNWADPSWGTWDSNAGSIEFNMGDEEEVSSFMLHVRADNSVISKIVDLVLQNGWQAIAPTDDGSFLEQKAQPEKGLEHWRNYRDQVVRTKLESPNWTSPAWV